MAQVPYKQQVQTNAVPGVRVTERAPIEAFGGGQALAATTNAAQGVLKASADVFHDERRKANETVGKGFDRDLKNWRNDRVYNPKTGAMNQKGQNAFGLVERSREDYDKYVSDLEKQATNSDQKEMLSYFKEKHWEDLSQTLQRHEMVESEKYQTEVYNTSLAAVQSDAIYNYQNPGKVKASIEDQKALIYSYAQDNGKDEEWAKLHNQAQASQLHVGVINRMLSTDQDLAAKKYYEEVLANQELTPDHARGLSNALEEGSLRGASQRFGDEVRTKGLSFPAAIAEARKEEDPKLRRAKIDQVTFDRNLDESARRDSLDKLYLKAVNIIDSSPGQPPSKVVPTSEWVKFPVEMRNALENRAQDPANNDKAWLEFLDMSPDQLQKLNRSEYESKFRGVFDKEHRNRADTMWNGARDSANKAQLDPKLTATMSFQDRIESTLKTAKVIPANKAKGKLSKDEATTYRMFETEAAKQLENFELNDLGGKRKATGQEAQKIIDDLTIKKVFIERWGPDREKPVGALSPEEKQTAYVPIDSIPLSDRQKLEAKIEASGRRATPSLVGRAFAAYQMGDRDLFNSIVLGK